MGDNLRAIKLAQLQILKNNFSVLLRKRTSPATKERFKKKMRLKELNLKIKEIEEYLKW